MTTLRKTNVLAVVAVLVAGLTLLPRNAQANWAGESGEVGECDATGGNITDNKDVYFFYDDISQEYRDAITSVRTDLINPTALQSYYALDGLTAQTDVVLHDRFYTDFCEDFMPAPWTSNGFSNTMGMASCTALVASNGRCDQQHARISNYYLEAWGPSGDVGMTCHEVGHTLGLRHRSGTAYCMTTAIPPGVAYTAHDQAHFAANWSTEPASTN